MEQAPKTTMTFSFASPFSFGKTSSNVNSSSGTPSSTIATTEQPQPFSCPSSIFKTTNVFGSPSKTQTSFSGFDSLSSGSTITSKAGTWPHVTVQNRPLFPFSTPSTSVFGKGTPWKLRSNFSSTGVQERKESLSFSFTKAFQQDNAGTSSIHSQDSSDIKASAMMKESTKESVELITSKQIPETDKLKHSPKQTGRLFGRSIAGVKTSSKAISLEPVSPTKEHQSRKEDKISRQHSFTEDRRIASPEEIRQITSIICAKIPAEVNNKTTLLNHFSKFGAVKKVSCNLKKEYAVIHFHDHDSANNAKRNGLPIVPGLPQCEIFWTQQSSSKKPANLYIKDTSKNLGKDAKMFSTTDSEVALELQYMTEGMGGNRSPFLPSRKTQQSQQQHQSNKHSQKQSRKSSKPPDKPSIKVQTETSEEALSAIMSKTAQTPSERFHVLDARDKLLRLRQQKQSDITKAKAIKGCCPDMCPEKERYSRAEKNCLSVFEMQSDSNDIDHKAVVKEYSRPSADQEEPLPHELRPPDVLTKTMDYLLCNIMDLTGFGIGDWYDFIWNRTRAIRKDITQQHLCSLESVELVEKCTRFHIHCSAVLCEEDMASFDSKINDENLTKCLQTLKHLYQDLDIQDIRCPREAEFRAYDVLLNLNKGDIVREVQQYPPHIRESKELKFATSIFMALNSNNYVRFFRLVRQTSYLNACLLHRYFSEVRIKALHTILKAYCVPNRSEQFPLSELIQVLAFENVSEVQNFCDALGLKSDSTFVILNRGNFVMPESSLPAPRAFQLIESKRTISIGELINGGSLPENPKITYCPHDSFDKEGNLKKEAYDASDQVAKCMKVQPIDVQSSVSLQNVESNMFVGRAPTAEKVISVTTALQIPTANEKGITNADVQIETFSEEAMQYAANNLITEVISCSAKEYLERELFLGRTSKEVFHHVLEKSCRTFLRELASEVLSTEKEAKINLLKAKEEERQLIEKYCAELVEVTLSEETTSLVRDVYNAEKMNWLESTSKAECESIFSEIVGAELTTLSAEVYTRELEQRKAALEKIQKRRELNLLHKAFSRWRQFYVCRRHLDHARRTFPSAPPLIKKYKKAINQDKALKFGQTLQATEINKEAGVHTRMLEVSRMWQPLNIENALQQSFTEKYSSCLPLSPFKLLLILPADDSEQSLLIREWFAAKFRHRSHIVVKTQCDVERLSMYVSKLEDGNEMLISVNCIDKCIDETMKGNLVKNRWLMGTNAFILVISKPDDAEFELHLQKERERLEEILLCRPFYPPVCLHVFVTGSQDSDEVIGKVKEGVAKVLCLSFLKNNNFICDWNISILSDVSNADADQQVIQALKYLSEKAPAIPTLSSSYLKDFMIDKLTEFVFNPIFNSLSKYAQEICHKQHPRIMIDFYNSAVEHMISIASSTVIEQLSWPLPEFFEMGADKDYPSMHWNTPDTLRRLEDKMRSVCLPKFPESFNARCEADIWKYVALVSAYSRRESIVLKSEISCLLEKLQNVQNNNLHWAVVLQACSFFILDITDFYDEETQNEWKIYYFEEDLECFQPPAEWIAATMKSPTSGKRSTKNKAADESGDKYTIPPKKQKLSSESTALTSTLFAVPDDLEEKVDELSAEIEAEREHSKSFMKLLEKLLEEGDISSNNISREEKEQVNEASPCEEDHHLVHGEDLEDMIANIASDLKSEQIASKLHTMRLNLSYENEILEIFGSSILKRVME